MWQLHTEIEMHDDDNQLILTKERETCLHPVLTATGKWSKQRGRQRELKPETKENQQPAKKTQRRKGRQRSAKCLRQQQQHHHERIKVLPPASSSSSSPSSRSFCQCQQQHPFMDTVVVDSIPKALVTIKTQTFLTFPALVIPGGDKQCAQEKQQKRRGNIKSCERLSRQSLFKFNDRGTTRQTTATSSLDKSLNSTQSYKRSKGLFTKNNLDGMTTRIRRNWVMRRASCCCCCLTVASKLTDAKSLPWQTHGVSDAAADQLPLTKPLIHEYSAVCSSLLLLLLFWQILSCWSSDQITLSAQKESLQQLMLNHRLALSRLE